MWTSAVYLTEKGLRAENRKLVPVTKKLAIYGAMFYLSKWFRKQKEKKETQFRDINQCLLYFRINWWIEWLRQYDMSPLLLDELNSKHSNQSTRHIAEAITTIQLTRFKDKFCEICYLNFSDVSNRTLRYSLPITKYIETIWLSFEAYETHMASRSGKLKYIFDLMTESALKNPTYFWISIYSSLFATFEYF